MVKEEKAMKAEELKKLIESYSVVGLVDVLKLPSRVLQEIRSKIKDKAIIKVVKKSILLHALEKCSNEKLKELKQFVPSQPALILSNLEWNKLFTEISKVKPNVFAKEGDTAEEDILVKAGPTELSPGPVISEFAKVKIPVGTEGGKIAVKKDTMVAKKGDKISKELAAILRKLKIKPTKVGLNVVGIFDGRYYGIEVLKLIGENYLKMIKDGFANALNLSIAIGYPTKENVAFFLSKAYQQAKHIENKISGGAN
jgi:large subunit ribosomal protein L10